MQDNIKSEGQNLRTNYGSPFIVTLNAGVEFTLCRFRLLGGSCYANGCEYGDFRRLIVEQLSAHVDFLAPLKRNDTMQGKEEVDRVGVNGEQTSGYGKKRSKSRAGIRCFRKKESAFHGQERVLDNKAGDQPLNHPRTNVEKSVALSPFLADMVPSWTKEILNRIGHQSDLWKKNKLKQRRYMVPRPGLCAQKVQWSF